MSLTFGKTFYTLKEARAYAKTLNTDYQPDAVQVRHMSKKIGPRRKKRYHVGNYMNWLNFD